MRRLRAKFGDGLKNRRGAFAVIFALILVGMMAIAGIAVDFSRAWTMRNELQTAADAAALAGAIQLIPPRLTGASPYSPVVDSAENYAKNTARVMGDSIRHAEITIAVGHWTDDGATRGFVANATPLDAVRVHVQHTVKYFFVPMLGRRIASPNVQANAIAWASAPVTQANCMRPWAVPYVVLMYRINLKRGLPNTLANLERTWDSNLDAAALNTMTDAERTFTLKISSQKNNTDLNAVAGDSANAGISGNFYGVRLGKYWDAATGKLANPAPLTGGNNYSDNVAGGDDKTGPRCYTIGVGDSLVTEQGNMVGPTDAGMVKQNSNDQYFVCETVANDGTCLTNGKSPEIKASFYSCGTGCNGKTTIGVNMIGSFLLQKYNKVNGNDASITGMFQPVQSSGVIGPGAATTYRLILVR